MTRVASCPTAAASLPHLGPCLRRLQGLQGILAEWAGVTQATVSRWERGALALRPELAGALLARLTERASRRSNAPLRRLVETSLLAVHLVEDAGHVLLAAPWLREREWNGSTSRAGRRRGSARPRTQPRRERILYALTGGPRPA